MNDLEKKLYNLPKAKLSLSADLTIRKKIYYYKLRHFASSFSSHFYFKKLSFKRAFAIITFVFLLFAAGGTSVYAYSNDNIIRGHSLYPIKRGIEKVELAIAFSPKNKVKIFNKLARRRLAEAEVISRLNNIDKLVLSKTIDDAVDDAGRAAGEFKKISNKQESAVIIQIISKTKPEQMEALENIANTVGIDTEEEIIDSVAIALESIQEQQNNILIDKDKFERTAIEREKNPLVLPKSLKEDIISPQESFNNLKKEVEKFKNNLLEKKISETELSKLFYRLDSKISKGQEAFNKGDLNQLRKIIVAVKALMNNSRHFLKTKTIEEIKAGQGTGKILEFNRDNVEEEGEFNYPTKPIIPTKPLYNTPYKIAPGEDYHNTRGEKD